MKLKKNQQKWILVLIVVLFLFYQSAPKKTAMDVKKQIASEIGEHNANKIKPELLRQIGVRESRRLHLDDEEEYDVVIVTSDKHSIQNPKFVSKYSNIVSVKMKKSEIVELAEKGQTQSVWFDSEPEFYLYKSVPRVHALTHDSVGGGEGVKVCVIDTHFDTRQPFLNFTKLKPTNNLELCYHFTDMCFHGTSVSSVIGSKEPNYRGIAPNAELYGSPLDLQLSSALSSIEWCAEEDTDIFSMSFGFMDLYFGSDVCDDNPLSILLNDIHSTEDVILVAAAGNGNELGSAPPACASSVISVGSVNNNSIISEFSSIADTVNITAPGQGILVLTTEYHNDWGYTFSSGTSFSAPHVSGLFALLKSWKPDATNQEIVNAVMDSAVPCLEDSCPKNEYGKGIIDGYASCQQLGVSGCDQKFNLVDRSQSRAPYPSEINWSQYPTYYCTDDEPLTYYDVWMTIDLYSMFTKSGTITTEIATEQQPIPQLDSEYTDQCNGEILTEYFCIKNESKYRNDHYYDDINCTYLGLECHHGACIEEPCIPDISCEAWSSCVNGVETRVCVDNNNCKYSDVDTPSVRSCENCQDNIDEYVVFRRKMQNQDSYNYLEHGNWVIVDYSNFQGVLAKYILFGKDVEFLDNCEYDPAKLSMFEPTFKYTSEGYADGKFYAKLVSEYKDYLTLHEGWLFILTGKKIGNGCEVAVYLKVEEIHQRYPLPPYCHTGDELTSSVLRCGDGLVTQHEDCDGDNLLGLTCERIGYEGGTMVCSNNCTFDVSDCYGKVCGNGEIDEREQCDGTNLGNQTCDSLGYGDGELECTEYCHFDIFYNCEYPYCNDGMIDQGEECDGIYLRGQSCETLGYDSGNLSCHNCEFDESGCVTNIPTGGGGKSSFPWMILLILVALFMMMGGRK